MCILLCEMLSNPSVEHMQIVGGRAGAAVAVVLDNSDKEPGARSHVAREVTALRLGALCTLMHLSHDPECRRWERKQK